MANRTKMAPTTAGMIAAMYPLPIEIPKAENNHPPTNEPARPASKLPTKPRPLPFKRNAPRKPAANPMSSQTIKPSIV